MRKMKERGGREEGGERGIYTKEMLGFESWLPSRETLTWQFTSSCLMDAGRWTRSPHSLRGPT